MENLREEVKKRHARKAEQGIFRSRSPLGYGNNKAERTMEIHPENAALVKRIFELYASGQYSLSELRRTLQTETGESLESSPTYMLTNPFYVGKFVWGGKLYRGPRPTFISLDLYDRAQGALRSHNKPKYGKQEIAFRGLLACGRDNCRITGERKKGKYVYCRCTGHRKMRYPTVSGAGSF